jgi:hypothetical protein
LDGAWANQILQIRISCLSQIRENAPCSRTSFISGAGSHQLTGINRDAAGVAAFVRGVDGKAGSSLKN